MVSAAKASRQRREAPDEKLLVEAAQRDPRCFGALYELHFHRVYAFVTRRLHSRSEAEDLTAEVFHKALANLGRFEWRGAPFSAWLYRIAANAIADHAHVQARNRDVQASGDPPGAEPGPEEIEQRARLYRLVDGLPADQRRVIIMRFAEQRPIRETAAALGRSEGAVKQLQFRALQSLRARMDESDA